MKILLASMQYGSAYNQGAERYMSNLAQELGRLGHQVIVAAGDPLDKYSATAEFEQVADSHYKLPTDGWSTTMGLQASRYLPLLKKLSPDIVHMIHPGHIGLSLLAAAKSLDIKTVITIVDFWWFCPKSTLIAHDKTLCSGNKSVRTCSLCIVQTHPSPVLARLSKFKSAQYFLRTSLTFKLWLKKHLNSWHTRPVTIKQLLANTDSIITLSRTASGLIKQQYSGLTTHCIPAGLHPRWFEHVKPWQAADFCQRPVSIGYAGAIAPHKGLHILLEALQRLPNDQFSLSVAGVCVDTVYQEQVQGLAKGLKVNWLGVIDEVQMLSFIDKIDLICVPSLSPENQPQVALESLARNTPVMSSDVPGCAELVAADMTYKATSARQLAERLSVWRNQPHYTTTSTIINRAESAERTLSIYCTNPGDALVSCS